MDKIVQAEAAIFIQWGLLGGAFCLQVVTIDRSSHDNAINSFNRFSECVRAKHMPRYFNLVLRYAHCTHCFRVHSCGH